jgi:hypothetical protein
MPAQAAAIPPTNADCSPTGRDRRLAEIVDLAGQHAGDPAGEEQGQIARRVFRLRSGLPEG